MVKFGFALSLKVAGTGKLKDIRFTFNLKLTSRLGRDFGWRRSEPNTYKNELGPLFVSREGLEKLIPEKVKQVFHYKVDSTFIKNPPIIRTINRNIYFPKAKKGKGWKSRQQLLQRFAKSIFLNISFGTLRMDNAILGKNHYLVNSRAACLNNIYPLDSTSLGV